MRVVALEEHFTVPDLVQRIDPNATDAAFGRENLPPAAPTRSNSCPRLASGVAGSTRFNELRRGVPRMSPAFAVAAAKGTRGGGHRDP
jgi:hypothetical protein